MSHSQSSLLDLPPFSHPQLLTIVLLPYRGDHHRRTVWSFGTQSPLTSYEPNAIVEISSTEVTPVHRPSRRTSFCSENIYGEDVTSAPVSPEVDERQSIGRQASRCSCRRKKQVQSLRELITLQDKDLCHAHPQAEVEQRHKKRTGETSHKWKNSIWTTISKRCPAHASRWSSRRWTRSLSWLSDAEFHTVFLLEEQRIQILSRAKSEILMQESMAERSDDVIREFSRQLRSQHIEIYHRDQGYEASRR